MSVLRRCSPSSSFSAILAALLVTLTLGPVAAAPPAAPAAGAATKGRYLMLMYEGRAAFAARSGPQAQAYWAGWATYVKQLSASGLVREGSGLMPPDTSRTLRDAGGSVTPAEGPAQATAEQLGGYFVLEGTLEEVTAWARKCPAVQGGSVELRPLLPPMQPAGPQP